MKCRTDKPSTYFSYIFTYRLEKARRRQMLSEPNSNGYIFDPESPVELGRLIDLDRVITQAMGGPLSGLPPLSAGAQVLDLACGPGGWVLDVAFARRDIEVSGVDISQAMISYAYARARTQGLTNVSFGVMDITHPLDFSDAAFDLLNARFLVAVLQRTGWASLLKECVRLLRSGGLVRLTDTDLFLSTNSPALSWMNSWFAQAMRQKGYGIGEPGRSWPLVITSMLGGLLQEAGFIDIQARPYAFESSYRQSPNWGVCFHQCEVAYWQAKPLLMRTGLATEEEFDRTYQQMLIEMQQENFCCITYGLTVIGTKP
jgi:ubiquinone/menaquinone biosynthesis C-methylase UbiE